MSFRTKELLESWLEEFRSPRDDCDNITVLMHDGGEGADTGLVYVPLTHAVTDVYMEPVAIGDPHWEIGFGSRTNSFNLSPAELRVLSEELAVASALCEFLERKSAEHISNH